MGHVADHLCHLLELGVGHLVQEQGEDDGAGEGCQAQEGDGQGVADHLPEVGMIEEADEVVEADPSASQDALAGAVLLECHQHAVHGAVFKYNNVDQGREQEHVPLPAFPQTLENVAPGARNDGFKSNGLSCVYHGITSRVRNMCPRIASRELSIKTIAEKPCNS